MKQTVSAVQATAPAPIGADPVGEFLKTLPTKSVVLGFKIHRSSVHSEMQIAYLSNGTTIHTSFNRKGGAV